MAYDGMLAESVRLNGHNGDVIDAYLARPLGAGPSRHDSTIESPRKFATAPDLGHPPTRREDSGRLSLMI
jgi:hypothetical protein